MIKKILRNILLILLFVQILFLFFLAIDYFYFYKSTSLKEYYYCKLYYNPNLESLELTNYIPLPYNDIKAVNEGDIFSLNIAKTSAVLVNKYFIDQEVGFYGIVKYDNICRLRKFTIEYTSIKEDKNIGIRRDVLYQGVYSDSKTVMNRFKEGDLINIFLIDEDNLDLYRETFCENGNASILLGDLRDYCFLEKFFKLESDNYYNFVLGIE